MSNKMARKMLEEFGSGDDASSQPTVKLDAETARVVKKWMLRRGYRATIAMLCKVADEALDAEKTVQQTTEQMKVK